jgi:hypothetical protein
MKFFSTVSKFFSPEKNFVYNCLTPPPFATIRLQPDLCTDSPNPQSKNSPTSEPHREASFTSPACRGITLSISPNTPRKSTLVPDMEISGTLPQNKCSFHFHLLQIVRQAIAPPTGAISGDFGARFMRNPAKRDTFRFFPKTRVLVFRELVSFWRSGHFRGRGSPTEEWVGQKSMFPMMPGRNSILQKQGEK